MDFLKISVGLLFALILLHALQTLTQRGKNLPPGPALLPLIGNLHVLGDRPHQSLARLASIYGPLMHLRLGSIDTVVVSSADVAKQVLQKHDMAFSGRAIPDALHAHGHFKYSVVWLPVAPRWRSLRKAMNSNIFSATRLDANHHLKLRRRKVEELIGYCGESCRAGATVDVGRATFRTALNTLSNTVFSTDLTDPFSDSAKEFKEVVANIMDEAGKPNLVDFFPFLARFDPQGIRRRMTVHFGKVIGIVGGLIDERLQKRKSQDQEGESDVIDILLNMPQEIDRTHTERMCLVITYTH